LRQPLPGNGFRTVASGAQKGFVEGRINSSQRALRYFKAKATARSWRQNFRPEEFLVHSSVLFSLNI
jgi:hypothetical protein